MYSYVLELYGRAAPMMRGRVDRWKGTFATAGRMHRREFMAWATEDLPRICASMGDGLACLLSVR